MSYRTLDVEAILKTLRRLERRIDERFPHSGLLSICHELVSLAQEVQQRANAIAAPNVALRATVYVMISAGVVGLLIIAFAIKFRIGSFWVFWKPKTLRSSIPVLNAVSNSSDWTINLLAEHKSIQYNAVHYGYPFDYSCRIQPCDAG